MTNSLEAEISLRFTANLLTIRLECERYRNCGIEVFNSNVFLVIYEDWLVSADLD